MIVVRNWREATPAVSHESAIIWLILHEVDTEGLAPEEAPLHGIQTVTIHRMQAGKSGDYHEHEDRVQVYYFTEGRGKMKIDGDIYEVKEGDAVCVPPKTRHQMINDSDDWLAHLIITAWVK